MASLNRLVHVTFPKAAQYAQATEWAGLRPATPSGAPILGATPVPGLWLNAGHGALGFTLSFGSARILSELMLGKVSPIPLAGMSLP
jgi:D-amino-acid dehydrogenase